LLPFLLFKLLFIVITFKEFCNRNKKKKGDGSRSGGEGWINLGIGVIVRGDCLGGVNGSDQGSWGDGHCREEEGDGERGDGDGGVG
jgi:hypothetical protein